MTQKAETLALNGGKPALRKGLKRYRSIGKEEVAAAKRVVRTGVLSRFLGCWDADFYGGEQVRAFEQEWAAHFGVTHAVSVNSNTSGLMAAVGAIGVEPGDEVIVSPWTMCASATAILVWNAIPVFADIEDQTFNLDPAAVERAITPRTRAIMVTDIFGHAARLDEIMAIARKHGLKVIEDAAQAPGAVYRGRYVGAVADIGVYSLNYHKHIHTGEGGMCVTRDARLAERLQLIRNHAEAVVGEKGVEDLCNMVGFNFRMTEVEAAIGRAQLAKLPALVATRQRAADALSERLRRLDGLRPPAVAPECTHVYYVYGMVLDPGVTGVARRRLCDALKAEGIPDMAQGYTNIHLLPMYQKRIAFGRAGFPWTGGAYRGSVCYDKGICPVAERLHEATFMGLQFCMHRYTDGEVKGVARAFEKVWRHLPELRA